MSEEHEFDVAGIVSAVNERTKVIFLCTPNNPTGNRMSEAAMRRILRLGLPTAIDEAYHELGETSESLAHLLAEFPNAILIRTFSKAFGLAGCVSATRSRTPQSPSCSCAPSCPGTSRP